MKKTFKILNLNFNRFFFLYKTWERNHPVEYFHAHEGVEFLYIHEGSGRLILGDRLYCLQPRTLVFFQPYQLHLVRYELPYTRSIVKVKLPLLEQCSLPFPHLSDFSSFLEKSKVERQVFHLTPQQDVELTTLLALFQETLKTVPNHEQREHFLVFLLQFLSYLRSRIFTDFGASARELSPRQAHHVEKIGTWIEQHFKEPFDLNKLAADIHLSASYLSNLFRQYTGSTITEHIAKRRLEEARLLLKTTAWPIDQVGKNSGFPNPAYFCRSFKKKFGLTPQQYRTKTVQSYGLEQARSALSE